MRRICCVALLALGLTTLGFAASAGTAAAAKPTPAVTATLTDNGACSFTLTATWKNAQVDQVIAQWYLDGAFWATQEAPSTGPNPGTFSKASRTAVFNVGPAVATPGVPHDWQVLVQFYYRGAFVAQVYSNTVTVECGFS